MTFQNARTLTTALAGILANTIVPGSTPPRRFDSVVGLGIALGATPDDARVAIRVFDDGVDIAPVLSQLGALPAQLDIRRVGRAVSLSAWQQGTVSPVRPGVSVSHRNGAVGTLGAIVRMADGTVGLLSSGHVLSNDGLGATGDDIIQPGGVDAVAVTSRTIGTLFSATSLVASGNTLDIGIAVLTENNWDPTIPDFGPLTSSVPPVLTKATNVKKFGRTTDLTEGVAQATLISVPSVDFGTATYGFVDQIEITSNTLQEFCSVGDSGALVFTESGEPLGVLFAMATTEDQYGNYLAYANPLSAVLVNGLSLII